MPIYEFNCGKCGRPTEVMQKLGERPPPCPHCGSKRMTRAVSKTSFALKGGGWYADLYATPRPGEKKPDGGGAPTTAEPKASESKASEPKGSESKAPDSKTPGTSPDSSAAKDRAGEAAKPAAGPSTKPEAARGAASSPPRRRPSAPSKRRR
jgi:putative FmdB family regulatory protein